MHMLDQGLQPAHLRNRWVMARGSDITEQVLRHHLDQGFDPQTSS